MRGTCSGSSGRRATRRCRSDRLLAALHAHDGLLPATAVQTLDEALSRSVAPRRFNLLLVDLFAVAALLLSALGVYSVSTQTMALRRRELAIRTALGAAPGGCLRLVIGGSMRPVLLGLVLGLGFALPRGKVGLGLALPWAEPIDPGGAPRGSGGARAGRAARGLDSRAARRPGESAGGAESGVAAPMRPPEGRWSPSADASPARSSPAGPPRLPGRGRTRRGAPAATLDCATPGAAGALSSRTTSDA